MTTHPEKRTTMTNPKDDTQFEGTRPGKSVDTVALDETWPVTVHIIPQAHIDLAWKWTADDGVEMVLETFRAHAELLEADESRTYAQSQLAAYEIVEREDPALFRRVCRLVANGQWEIVGGEWVEPDRGVPAGESFVRQLLEGQRYAQEKLGARARVAWSPDAFTWHPPNLPQLLRSAGLEFQVIKRPREKYISLPLVPFRWRGIDGAELVTYRSNNKGAGLPVLSEGTPDPENGRTHLHEYADAFRKIDLPHLWGPRGVGDTGGTNEYPEPAAGPGWRSMYSTPSRYVDGLRTWGRSDDLPVVEGAIGPIMTGCLTTHHEMKSLNRRAENVLQSAETIESIARMCGALKTGQTEELQESWRRVLFNQFHDVITGVGIHEIHRDAAHGYEESIRVALNHRRTAVRSLARHIRRDGHEPQIVVVNDLGWRRTDVVSFEIDLGKDVGEHWEAIAPDGSATPVTIHSVKQAQSWKRHQCSFVASDVPGMGWRAYRLRSTDRTEYGVRSNGGETITDHFTVRFNNVTGTIAMLMNRTDAVAFETNLGLPRLYEEGKYFFDYGVEHRAWYLGLSGIEKPVDFVGFRTLVEGPSYAEYETRHRFGYSEITQRYIIRPNLPYIRVEVEIDWHEIEHLLRLHFPTGLNGDLTAAFDTAYGVHEHKPSGIETPMQMFCDLSDGVTGLGILNDGRYGAMANGDELTISAVRCATLPDPRSDEGTVRFAYALVPHAGTWRDADLPRLAYSFNRPLVAMPVEPEGTGPSEASILDSQSDAILPTVMKPAADADGYVVRLYHAAKERSSGSVRLGVRARISQTNILEDRDSAGKVNPADVEMKPFEIATWRIDLKE